MADISQKRTGPRRYNWYGCWYPRRYSWCWCPRRYNWCRWPRSESLGARLTVCTIWSHQRTRQEESLMTEFEYRWTSSFRVYVAPILTRRIRPLYTVRSCRPHRIHPALRGQSNACDLDPAADHTLRSNINARVWPGRICTSARHPSRSLGSWGGIRFEKLTRVMPNVWGRGVMQRYALPGSGTPN
jgi:hypothetical protein